MLAISSLSNNSNGNTQDAVVVLASLVRKLDGDPQPRDRMVSGQKRDDLRIDTQFLIALIN